jgi:hypothetical protein
MPRELQCRVDGVSRRAAWGVESGRRCTRRSHRTFPPAGAMNPTQPMLQGTRCLLLPFHPDGPRPGASGTTPCSIRPVSRVGRGRERARGKERKSKSKKGGGCPGHRPSAFRLRIRSQRGSAGGRHSTATHRGIPFRSRSRPR